MYQIESGPLPTVATMVAKAEEVVTEVEAILASPVFRVNIGHFYRLTCGECGTLIKRRSGSFTPEQGIVCSRTSCGAVYDLVVETNPPVLKLRQLSWDCPTCRARNLNRRASPKDGAKAACAGCGASVSRS